ncbi:MAG: hypothetical protein SOX30_05450 [Lachnospiraceae bacterium]|nr:hypothetical protein [Lachnospiraceae bacterium]
MCGNKVSMVNSGKSNLFLRSILLVIGTMIAAFGIDLAINAGFGGATLAILWQGLSNVFPITIGQSSIIIAVAMVLFCWFYDRKQIHVGTLVYQLVYGFCIDIFEPYLIYSDNRMINFLLMLLGITFLSLGSALYSIADLGRGSYEAMTFALVNRRGWKISYTRIGLDIICVVTGFALGGKVGLCTIATILISGPLLQLFVKMCKSVIQI